MGCDSPVRKVLGLPASDSQHRIFLKETTVKWVYYVYVSHSVCVQHFATPWTVAHQAPLSMEFSRQEYWRIPWTEEYFILLWRRRFNCECLVHFLTPHVILNVFWRGRYPKLHRNQNVFSVLINILNLWSCDVLSPSASHCTLVWKTNQWQSSWGGWAFSREAWGVACCLDSSVPKRTWPQV